MIAYGRLEGDANAIQLNAIPRSLGVFKGQPADHTQIGPALFANLAGISAKRLSRWDVPRAPGGNPVLLSGWIDNRAELAAQLGMGEGCDARLYGAAVDRWGIDADRHVIGTYAALVALPEGRLRLSRSPWTSKSLFYFHDDQALLVCSVPRPLFAAGVPKRLREAAVDGMLAMELPDEEQSSFEGIKTVPQGAVVLVDGRQARTHRWYDPLDIAEVRLPNDAAYVEAANAMLAEAVAKVATLDGKLGIALSGGLDSAMACDELLRQLPDGQRLKSFTFQPLAEWDGITPANKFGDDRPFVEQFAAMHPALDPVFVDNRDIGFDDRAEQLFLSIDAGYPSRTLYTPMHGVLDAARREGCDWLLTADCGNLTYSNSAPWAYAELLRSGQLRQLWRLAANRLGDPRPIWRRLIALAVMPGLPRGMRDRLREMVHRRADAEQFANPFLRRDGRLGAYRRESHVQANIMTVDRDESRAQYIRGNYHAAGLGCETGHAYEEIWGLRMRDVTAYRPLIEFCFGLPTDQFVRDGETRWLARRMGQGRMPEAQRFNRLYGEHNVDWHARLTPRLPELRARIAALARHPDLGPLFDTDAMLNAIDTWPDHTPSDPVAKARLQFFLPAILYVARYVDFTTGRNQS